MRVDFYQLGTEAAERAIPLLAAKVRQAGEKLLVVAQAEAQLRAVSAALWAEAGEEFLAHGFAGDTHSARQPILLAPACEAANGARMVMFADGLWRDEGLAFSRAFLLFDDAGIEGARGAWRQLGSADQVDRRFWKRENGRWREGP
ncbi:DNA polymerase III subunit chi [Altererythrobacter sp. CC-YST694]|uniref:DNA polymerase III subunit chi n=1 Tax=Altererythrobacter sp. CC-YST694 TaxID=2755038 RepID=UPI001D02E405|nr:DNA polymerase III subunit chi [Altererythrobacter sp. CC-YST694]MCB5424973.1 DNA polymerase III subunit chi [Altererythrobacter sp. CC-YST694]